MDEQNKDLTPNLPPFQAESSKPAEVDPLQQIEDESLIADNVPKVSDNKKKNFVLIAVGGILLFFILISLFSDDKKDKQPAKQLATQQPDQKDKPEGKVPDAGPVQTTNAVAQSTPQAGQQNQSVANDLIMPPPPPPPPPVASNNLNTGPSSTGSSSLPPISLSGGDQGKSQFAPKSIGSAPPLPGGVAGQTPEEMKQRLTAPMFIGGSGGGSKSSSSVFGGNGSDEGIIAPSAAETTQVTIVGNLRDTILQGKIIDAVIESAINTDLPGNLRAIVSRDIYAESGKRILVPKGSRLIGSYQTDIKYGQARVYIIWTRVIRPDGIDAVLDSQAVDLLGRSGIYGELDQKFFEIFGSSILLSALSIGFAAAADTATGGGDVTQGETGSGDATTSGSVSSLGAQSAIDQFGGTVTSMTEKMINVSPRITIDQGTKIKIFVNKDIKFPSEYLEGVQLIR